MGKTKDYQVVNHIDARTGRMLRLPTYYQNGKPEQIDSHDITYLDAREELKKMGFVMGLEQEARDRPTVRQVLINASACAPIDLAGKTLPGRVS